MTISRAGRTFGDRVIAFNRSLDIGFRLPRGVQAMNPFADAATRMASESFYATYYADRRPRRYIFGINPGRRGAGVTGVPFTDPIRLEEACGIPNAFPKVPELSSTFVYRVIEAWGGPKAFYDRFFITAVFPLGFLKNGRNLNYYDDPALLRSCSDELVRLMNRQLAFGREGTTCFCLGAGRNLQVLERFNTMHGWFSCIVPLPHPRWVMQYRRRRVDAFVREYVDALAPA